MSNLDPLESEKRRTEAATREYWRMLRGQIYLELVRVKARNGSDVTVQSVNEDILKTTNEAVIYLYLQDQRLFLDDGKTQK